MAAANEDASQLDDPSKAMKSSESVEAEFRAVANIVPGVHVSSSRDVTERKRAENALREAEEKYKGIFNNAVEGIFQLYYEGTAQDIIERKRTEALLRESEERYRELFENAKDAIYVHDLAGTYLSVNRAAEKLIGYAREEILGKNFADFFPPEQLKCVRESLCRKLAEQGETTYEAEVIARDGRRVPIEISSRLIYENGSVIGVQGMARDITERKRAEDALRKTEQEQRQVVQYLEVERARLAEAQAVAKVGSWELDLRNNLLTWSDETYRIFGMDRTRFGASYEAFLERVHPDDRAAVNSAYTESVANHRPYAIDHRMQMEAGSIKIVHERCQTYYDDEGKPIRSVGTCQDITQRKQAEDEIKATSDQLRALSAGLRSAREEEGARIARELHDELGSALTSLNWDLEEIDRALAGGDQRDISGLREKIGSMTMLVDATINTVRRISSELRPSRLDDLGLLEAIEWQAQQFQVRTGIFYHSDCSLENVNLNRDQSTAVFRIFQEALTNILRHAGATRFAIAIKQEANDFVLSVSDNGRGITENEMSGPQSLGLLGMRERAHLIGGKVNIAGIKGHGTTITVRVPMASVPFLARAHRAAGSGVSTS